MSEQSNKIIALIDGSAYSTSVCDHAAWISRVTGAPVELTHILGRREATNQHDLSGTIKLGARSALMEELAELDAQRSRLISKRGRAILDDARIRLEQAGIEQITTRLRHGDIIEAVADIEAEARVIMIGKRGEAADFAKGHLGSNLERVVRASHKPVFVASRAFRPISKVLVAFDGGASAIKAVDHISRSSLFQDLEVHLVTVGDDVPETRNKLVDAKSKLEEVGIKADMSVMSGQPGAVLGKLVETAPYDMLVMGAYGHSRIRNLIIGSTTTEMVRTCKVPVVLLR